MPPQKGVYGVGREISAYVADRPSVIKLLKALQEKRYSTEQINTLTELVRNQPAPTHDPAGDWQDDRADDGTIKSGPNAGKPRPPLLKPEKGKRPETPAERVARERAEEKRKAEEADKGDEK